MGKQTSTKTEERPTAFNGKEFEEQLIKHVRENGGTKALYKEDFVQGLIQSTMQALLNVEMEEHLGYPKHGKSTDGNARNGTTKKRIRGDFGEMEIESPRDRAGTFQPQVLPKREKNLGNFSEKVVSLYTRGLTTREITEHLQELYGVEASAQFVSRATDAVETEVKEWQNRALDKVYPVVYVDGLRLPVRSDEPGSPIFKKCLYIVLGVDFHGKQDVLGLWMEKTEGARFWLNVFNDLKARGVQDILILCGDGLTGLPDAVDAVFPRTDVQLCVVHQIRNATKFVSFKDRREFCKDMKPLYNSPTLQAAELALENFADKWQATYPASIASWRNSWDKLTTFYDYPPELRKFIYTTNRIESLNAQIRKNTRNRKVFPNDSSVFKIVYLNIRNFTKKWTKRHGWTNIIQQLIIKFPDRLSLNDGI